MTTARKLLTTTTLASIMVLSPLTPTAQGLINGTDATSPHAQNTAYLHIGQLGCTGVAINPEWILTADHCFNGYNEGDTSEIRIGADRTTAQPQTFTEYHQLPEHDVALIKIPEPVNVPELDLWSEGDPAQGTQGTALGWGHQGQNFTTIQQAEVISVDDKRWKVTPMDHMMVYGFNTQTEANIIQGDSGGPVFVDNKLYGTLSMISPNLQEGVDTNTAWYVPLTDYAAKLNDITGLTVPTTPPTSSQTTTPTTSGETPDPTTTTPTTSDTTTTETPSTTQTTQQPTQQEQTTRGRLPVLDYTPTRQTPPPPAAPAPQAPAATIADENKLMVDTGGEIEQEEEGFLDKLFAVFV